MCIYTYIYILRKSSWLYWLIKYISQTVKNTVRSYNQEYNRELE